MSNDFEDARGDGDFNRLPAILTWCVWIDLAFEEQILCHFDVAGAAGGVQTVEA